MKRVQHGVTRPESVTVVVDGHNVAAYPGESASVAVLAAGLRFRKDRSGRARGMFCNMGTCSECTVWIGSDAGGWRRQRACLVPVAAGMQIRTDAPDSGA